MKVKTTRRAASTASHKQALIQCELHTEIVDVLEQEAARTPGGMSALLADFMCSGLKTLQALNEAHYEQV